MSDPQQPPSNPYGQPPANPYGEQPANPYGQQPQYPAAPYAGAPYSGGQYPGQQPPRRPGNVTAACWITIVFSAITFLGSAVMAAVFAFAPADLVDEMDAEIQAEFESAGIEGITADDVLVFLAVLFAVLAVWALIALVLAVVTLRGKNWARITLLVSCIVTALLSLLGITSIVSILWLAASIAVAIMLFTGGANPWFASRKGTVR